MKIQTKAHAERSRGAKNSVKKTTIVLLEVAATERDSMLEAIQLISDDIEVVAFREERKALDFISKNQTSMFVIDHQVASRQGIATIVKIRSAHSLEELPIVLINYVDDPEVRYLSLHAGANEIYSRPVDIAEFHIKASNLLNTHHQFQLFSQELTELRLKYSTNDNIPRNITGSLLEFASLCSLHSSDRVQLILRLANMARLIASAEEPKADSQEALSVALAINMFGLLAQAEAPTEADKAAALQDLITGSDIPLYMRYAAEMELYKGSPYKGELKSGAKERIPLAARISNICAVFIKHMETADNTIESIESTIAELAKGRGKDIDPSLLDGLLNTKSMLLG